MTTYDLWRALQDEMSKADARYGCYRSAHEGYPTDAKVIANG